MIERSRFHIPHPFCVRLSFPSINAWVGLVVGLVLLCARNSNGAVIFQDDFNLGFPGWAAIQPAGAYLDGPLCWQYDIVSGGFVEDSNIYTDSATFSPSA